MTHQNTPKKNGFQQLPLYNNGLETIERENDNNLESNNYRMDNTTANETNENTSIIHHTNLQIEEDTHSGRKHAESTIEISQGSIVLDTILNFVESGGSFNVNLEYTTTQHLIERMTRLPPIRKSKKTLTKQMRSKRKVNIPERLASSSSIFNTSPQVSEESVSTISQSESTPPSQTNPGETSNLIFDSNTSINVFTAMFLVGFLASVEFRRNQRERKEEMDLENTQYEEESQSTKLFNPPPTPCSSMEEDKSNSS